MCGRTGYEADQTSDGLIVNLGSDDFTLDNITSARDLKRWHCDGDVRAIIQSAAGC